MNLGCFSQQKMETLVLIDGSDSLSIVTKNYLLPYLDHLGIAYELADIKTKKLIRDAGDYSLIIIGHNMKKTKSALKLIKKIQAKGAGVVSFDPEWAPDNQTEISAARGVSQLKRALSSRALAVLFTHETDFIYKIKPDSWEAKLKLVSEGISNYYPMLMTMDDALKIVRAHKTSHLKEVEFQKKKDLVDISLVGDTDTKSYVYLFTGEKENISQRLIEIPEFKVSTNVVVSTK